jgi:hypothetical protein
MEAGIKEFLSLIKVGTKQSHKNMTLYCLLSAHEAPVDFLTLEDALDNEVLAITEVNEGGSVPELKVANRSDQKVLLLDGEELVGAKQNRVLNVTILVAAQSETVIPVSCVERGRWSYRSRQFGSESRAMSAQLRKRKSETVSENLRSGRQFRSDQGVVWEEIENKYARMEAERSPTMAMADLYESHKDLSNEYLTAFRPVDNQIGMVVFVDGKVAGLELLANFQTFQKIHSKLVNSYVMDALETAKSQEKMNGKTLKAKASKILDAAQKARLEVRRSVALGNDVRFESSDVIGAGLEFEGQILQLSIFSKNWNAADGKNGRSLGRASRRKSSLRRD